MKACVFTLGCKMNEVESASLMRGLEDAGYEVTDELSYAELYVLNTCAVTAEAEKKSRQAVARIKKYNPNAKIFVCGCAAEHNKSAFASRDGVQFVTGAVQKGELLQKILGREFTPCAGFDELPFPKQTKTRAFLRVQDGCNRFCSYCLIPYLRGRSRSRSKESVLAEARFSSAREIVLTGIDVSSYRDGESDLGDLLLLLSALPARIRVGSLEASIITSDFLTKMKAAKNAVPHFHLSLQSGSSAVLRSMNRRYTREEYLDKCRMIYEFFPDAAITTDLIVGYPTETEADFQDSLSIIAEAGFARVHCFPFSVREGTQAQKLKDLSPLLKKERMGRILAAAAAAEEAYRTRFLGTVREALFEEDGGYTDNYIRVYAEGGRAGLLTKVRMMQLERDGVRAEIIE